MRYLRHYLFTFLLLIGSWSVQAQSAATGAIRGRIVDELGLAMPGATVQLPELGRGTITNVEGNFTLVGVPEGTHNLAISYIGYGSETRPVSVAGSLTEQVEVQLQPGVLIGDEVLILGDRLKGQAKALNQQRTNTNITNIVSSEQVGRFPDANIGDAMKRIPGITIQNDQGEARDIIIRGLAPQLNSVMLNGERIPSAEGDNRRVQMDLIPADMIQTIEVNKAVLPDMDADAIGGAVNLVTRAAPNGLRVSGTAASGYNFLSQQPIWTGAFIAGNRFLNGKLGAVLSASYHNHNFGSDNIEGEWVPGDEVGVPEAAVLGEFDIRKYVVQRVRRSASLAFDYEINPNHTVYLSGIYNWRDDWENRYRLRVSRIGDDLEDGNFERIGPGVYDLDGRARVEYQTKGGIDNNRVRNQRLEDQRVVNLMTRGNHLFGQVKANWSLNYARASEERPNERYVSYRSAVPVRLDVSNPEKPLANLLNPADASGIEFNELYEENGFTFDEDINGRLDLLVPYSRNGFLKFGGRVRTKVKKRDNGYVEFSPLDEDVFATLGSVPTSDETDENYLAGSQYSVGRFASREFLGGLDLGNRALFDAEDALAEYLPGNYFARENIYAGYVMADHQITRKLSAVVGLRLEQTNIDYQGFIFNEDTEDFSQEANEDNYLNVLPGVHLKYNLGENTIFRAAWTNTLARPNYFDLVPYAQFSPEDNALARGNPGLRPTVAMNWDLMAEHYFRSIGLVSGGVFYKDISDFIYTQTIRGFSDPQFGENLDFTRPANGGTADVYGLEVAFQRQLDFLPGALKGFGIYTNYTRTESSTTGIEGREGENIALPGTARNMFNASLSYETAKLVLRISLNYASDYVDELGEGAFFDRFYDRQTFLDFNGSYAFTPRLRVFVELNNLTNQPLRFYQGVRVRTMQEEFYSVRANLGLKFDLFGD